MNNDNIFIISAGVIPGLVLIILGIAFLRDRMRFLKSGNIALATIFKLEERIDYENDTWYVPFFKFTTDGKKEIIYEYHSTQSRDKWAIGNSIKVVYREGLFEKMDVLRLSFYDVFRGSTALLTCGLLILISACSSYFNVSEPIHSILIPGSIVLFLSLFYLWASRFLKHLEKSS